LERGCFLSDCIGSTYDIEDIYNNMKALLLVYNSDYNNVKNQSNKKRKVSSSNNTNNSIESDLKESDNMFNAYHELPDFMFRKKHAQHFLQTFKLPPINCNNSTWPFTIYFFSGNNIYYSDGYNGAQCGEYIFHKSINKQPIIYTNFINQLC